MAKYGESAGRAECWKADCSVRAGSLAPFYVGLVLALAMLLIVFLRDLVHMLPDVLTARCRADDRSAVLTLIDLSLAANLRR